MLGRHNLNSVTGWGIPALPDRDWAVRIYCRTENINGQRTLKSEFRRESRTQNRTTEAFLPPPPPHQPGPEEQGSRVCHQAICHHLASQWDIARLAEPSIRHHARAADCLLICHQSNPVTRRQARLETGGGGCPAPVTSTEAVSAHQLLGSAAAIDQTLRYEPAWLSRHQLMSQFFCRQ